MNRTLKLFAALAMFAAPLAAQANANTPIVTVLAFDNNSIGPGAKDWDGIGKGIMDLMITDLASGTKVRVVDRERVNKLLEEQNLTKSGAVDGNTAIRVGKLFGACYSIYGSYMRLANGNQTLIIHTTNNETGQIQNPVKIESKNDNIMEVIAEASSKFVNSMNVTACPGTSGGARRGDDAAQAAAAPATGAPAQAQATAPAQQGASAPATKQPAANPSATKTATPAVRLYSKSLSEGDRKKLMATKLDARTMLVYSRALDAKDRKENARAKQLAQQVLATHKDFTPAIELISAIDSGT